MDQAAFIQVWMPLAERFYRAAFYMLETEDEAEDVVQDLFMKLWSRRDALETVKSPEAFGLTLLKRLCIDRIRHAATLRTESLDGVTAPDGNPPPDRLSGDRDALRRLRGMMDRLPDQQRTVLRMRIVEGREYDEIAAATGLTPLHLRVLLSTARKTLKKQWENIR